MSLISQEVWTQVLTWATLFQWIAISLVFVYDSLHMHIRARTQYRLAKEIGNGRIVVARFRRMISRWYIVGSGIALALGLLSTFSNLFLPHPPTDTRLVGAIIRQGIIVMLFAFWRTKRANVIMQRQLDARTESRLMETADDTNERVRRIEGKLEE